MRDESHGEHQCERAPEDEKNAMWKEGRGRHASCQPDMAHRQDLVQSSHPASIQAPSHHCSECEWGDI